MGGGSVWSGGQRNVGETPDGRRNRCTGEIDRSVPRADMKYSRSGPSFDRCSTTLQHRKALTAHQDLSFCLWCHTFRGACVASDARWLVPVHGARRATFYSQYDRERASRQDWPAGNPVGRVFDSSCIRSGDRRFLPRLVEFNSRFVGFALATLFGRHGSFGSSFVTEFLAACRSPSRVAGRRS